MTQSTRKRKIFDGRYEILSIVGRGARSVVYHARQAAPMGLDVALKVLLSPKGDRSTAEMLRKEALAMVAARHKYIVRLDDFHSVGELSYLSLEYAPESDLRRYVARLGGKLGPIQGQLFLLQAAEALNFVHQAGMIHRDIKPDNLLVINSKEIRLADFGVAVLPGENASLEDLQKGVGTMSYMAPEVLEGVRYDQKSDIYALGITFYEMISGSNPFEKAPLMEQLEIRRDGAFPHISSLVPNIPQALADVVMLAMSYDPQKRPATAREMISPILELNEKRSMEKKERVTEAQAEPAQGTAAEPEKAQVNAPARETRREVRAQEPPVSKTSVSIKAPVSQGRPTGPAFTLGEKKSDSSLTQPKGIHAVAPRTQPAVKQPEDSSVTKTVLIDREVVDTLRNDSKIQKREQREPVKKPERKEPSPQRPAHVAKEPVAAPVRSSLRTRFAVTVALAALLLGIIPVIGKQISGLGKKEIGEKVSKLISPASDEEPAESPIPRFTASELTFPDLPAGQYTGSISGLLPQKKVALSFISFPDAGKLAVFVGLEGWTPAIVDLSTDTSKDGGEGESGAMRVKSAGLVLELTGQNVDGELMGYFRNIVTGEQGEWRAGPLS